MLCESTIVFNRPFFPSSAALTASAGSDKAGWLRQQHFCYCYIVQAYVYRKHIQQRDEWTPIKRKELQDAASLSVQW
jgi:hypothetical protein